MCRSDNSLDTLTCLANLGFERPAKTSGTGAFLPLSLLADVLPHLSRKKSPRVQKYPCLVQYL